MKPTTSEYVVLKRSKVHGTGVFAKKNIPKDTDIIEYVGRKITKAESDKISDVHMNNHKKNTKDNGAVYIFTLNKKYDIDGQVPWNTAKFINHSCNPNCEADIKKGHIWISSVKDIEKGEEISYNYGYDLDCYEEHPCRCGSKNCVGYIVAEEDRPKLKKILAKKKVEKTTKKKTLKRLKK